MTPAAPSTSTASNSAVAAWRRRAGLWWQGRAARERQLLSLGAAVLGLILLWALAVQPALGTLKQAATERDRLDAQWQAMQRLAVETRSLGATPALPAAQAAAALQAATERLGTQGQLLLQGERAVLTLDNASPGQLRDWLAEARAGARARPVEAALSRAPGGGFSGSLVVSLGGAP